MEDKKVNLWKQVGNQCLKSAFSLLEKETAPTEATVETVKSLVETAISIDMLNLQWVRQNRSRAAVFRGNGRVSNDDFAKGISAPALKIQGQKDLKQQLNSILKNEMAEDLASSAHTHEW